MTRDPENAAVAKPFGIGATRLRAILRLAVGDNGRGGDAKWLERKAHRPRLHGLSDHMLQDVGMSRRDVDRDGPRWSGDPF